MSLKSRDNHMSFTCSHCGNVESFPPSATIKDVCATPCAKCGKLGKLPPRLVPKRGLSTDGR